MTKRNNIVEFNYPAEREPDIPENHDTLPGRPSDSYLAKQLAEAIDKWQTSRDMGARNRVPRYLRQLCKRYGLRVGGR